MTGDRIRWCMQCNLITASRRCPECGKDVLNIHLDRNSKISPVFQHQAGYIRRTIDGRYGEGCGELLLPDGNTALFSTVQGSRQIIADGGIVGKVTDPGDVSLNASGLRKIDECIVKNIVVCDHDTSYFVSKGRNVMVTGITECSDGLSKGDIVAVRDYRGEPIAEGVMRMSSDEIGTSERGVAVAIRDCQSPRVSTSGKRNDWKRTIESNSASMRAFAGDTARNIGYLSSSYGYPFVVQLSSGIVSEANLLLVLDAGFRPSVMIEKEDDFVCYLADKHGLDVITDIPDRCILITERTGISSSDIIPHSPTDDWDQTMVWMYVMMKAEPFDPSYMRRLDDVTE